MYSSVKNKRKRKDRERKAELVRWECSLCKGAFCSAKKARRHKAVFGNKDFDHEFSLRSDDPEFSGHLSDSSSSLSAGHQSPTIEGHSTHENEDDNSLAGSEIHQENFGSDIASGDSSDFSREDDFGNDGQSTEGLSDESSGLSDSEEEVINFSAVSSESSNDEEGVVGTESDHDLRDDELDRPSTLPLFEGSSKTVLEALAGYFYWFSSHPSISKSALSSLLSHEHFNVLPPGNNLPSTYEQAVNFIKPQLLPTVCYHVCPNDCVLFRKTNRYDYSKLKNCPKCNGNRFAVNGQPLRRFLYYPVGPRWRRLYECEAVSKLLQSHSLRNPGNLMTDVCDSPCWRAAYAEEGFFQGDPRGLSVQLSTNGVNPFSANKITYSMWPIMLSVLNWPKTHRNRFENIMLVGIIPANGKEEPKSVDPYVEVLVDEVMELSGTTFYDGFKRESFTFRVRFHNYVLDYPGLNKVFCSTGAGALQGCMWCEIFGTHVAALDKVVYLHNRRFLPASHSLRKAKKNFPSGKAEHRPAPEKLTQEEVMVNSLAYENAKNATQAAGFATATGSKGCYCLMILPDHDRTQQVFPDMMHLMKNVTCEIVQLLTGYKDSAKVRKAEQELGRFSSSWIQGSQEKSSESATIEGKKGTKGKKGKKKDNLPDAPFRLSNDALKIADTRARNIQVPVGYGWTPKPIFSKYSYMKSHDWKQVATDGILKFCFRNPLLGKNQRTTIFKLFDILAALCDDFQDSRQVEALEEEINVVLALIERDFPISIQTISMHMLHHIARGISCHGPVHSWWMYVYERMNSWICRRVTNRCHPEANVMETYRIFDWCQFMNVTGELAFHEPDQEKPYEAMQTQDPDDKRKNSDLEKGEFMVLRQSYVDHVQAKYGVGGDLPTMLVLVPSHVPQCVEIFNESNIGKKNVAEAFQTAAGLCEALEEERFELDNRRSLIKAQDKEFLEQEEQSMPVKSSENTNEEHGAKAHRKDQSTPARCHSNEDSDAKARRIREDRQNRVPPEPKKGHFIILRFGDLKFQRKFKTTALFQEVYDWAGSIESLPLHFTLQRRQEVILHEHQLTEQEVLDVYEREQDDVKELLATQGRGSLEPRYLEQTVQGRGSLEPRYLE